MSSVRRGRVRLAWMAGLAVVVLAGCVGGDQAFPGAAGSQAPVSRASVSQAPASAGFRPTGPTQLARVTRITDGDTIRVAIDGLEYRVRYIGIDTPESVAPGQPVEPFALTATEANAILVTDSEVVLERDVSETDRYGRLLRHVWLAPPEPGGGTDAGTGTWRLVSLELLQTGLAQVTTYPPDVKYVDLFVAAQREAREAEHGMWGAD